MIQKNKSSKYLSLLLRHKPEKENLELDSMGYAAVDDILRILDCDIKFLEEMVETNNKKRFAFNNDKSKIRASQGHSIDVDLDLKRTTPPLILYHGTTSNNSIAISKKGLLKMNRNHVHLSEDIEVAKEVGMRYAKNKLKLCLIKINAKEMHNDGYCFYKSQNGVWLTDNVPPKYMIIQI